MSHGVLSGILFSFFLRAATTLAELDAIERYRDEIHLVVIGSDLLDHLIDGSDPPDFLGEFLESRFWIDKKRLFENMRQSRVDMSEDEFSCSLESLIQIESSDDRLEGIGEDIRILMSLRIVLATRDLYCIREMEPMSNLSEITATYKGRSDIGELSLRLARECVE